MELADTLAFDVRLRGTRLKAVLRELARRHLCDRVPNAPKRGFEIPVCRWMTSRWRATVDDAFDDSLLVKEGWIQGEALRARWKEARTRNSVPMRFWYLFVFESWMRRARSQTSLPAEVRPA